MEARILKAVVLTAALSALGANFRSDNFIVSAPTTDMARQIGQAAENFRRQLAIDWLGQELRPWAQPCPITAQVGDNLGAGGATSFLFERGEVFGWRMTIQGSLVRILDSVLPHEVTHTIFATHFRQPLPRWADEGACTTVEHYSEKAKQQTMLIDFLRTGRGIPFGNMFVMKEYPHDVMPLYSQGYSLANFLIGHGGRQKFLTYLADGMRDENWRRATQQHYGYTSLGVLQTTWLDWVRRGSPPLNDKSGAATQLAGGPRPSRNESDVIYRGQSADPPLSTVAAASNVRPASATTPVTPVTAASTDASIYSQARQQERVADNQGNLRWSQPAVPAATAQPANPLQQPAQPSASMPLPSGSQPTARTEPPLPHSVTRPQDVQQARQIILEWSK